MNMLWSLVASIIWKLVLPLVLAAVVICSVIFYSAFRKGPKSEGYEDTGQEHNTDLSPELKKTQDNKNNEVARSDTIITGGDVVAQGTNSQAPSGMGQESASSYPKKDIKNFKELELELYKLGDGPYLNSLSNLFWKRKDQKYWCERDKAGFGSSQEVLDHYFKYRFNYIDTSRVTEWDLQKYRYSLQVHLNAIKFLGDHPGMISSITNKKRGYDQEYLERRLNLMPGFVSELKKVQGQIKTTGPYEGAELFGYLYNNGSLLTKMHPKVYGCQEVAFPSVPNAFLSILEQLTTNYRPCPRDNDPNAPGTVGYKKAFNHKEMKWVDTGLRGKSGPKRRKPNAYSMQKTSTTLASPFGFDSFGEGRYSTGFAFNANECNIDDQYTWFENGYTFSKPWYTKEASTSPDFQPASFLGLQLNNLFYAAHGLIAPQNEVLARPTLKSVVAVVAEESENKDHSIKARISALIQCHIVNIYRLKENYSKVVVIVKGLNKKYSVYQPKSIAEDLVELMKSSLDEPSHHALVGARKSSMELLRQAWVVKLPENVTSEIKSLIGQSKHNMRPSLLDYAGRFSDSYQEKDILSQWAPVNCLKVVSDKKGESADGIKSYLRDLSHRQRSGVQINTIELNAIKLRIMDKPYKGYSSDDVLTACAVLGDEVTDYMIPQLTKVNRKKLREHCDDCLKRTSSLTINNHWGPDTYMKVLRKLDPQATRSSTNQVIP
ncbi:hypothetical protein OAT84_02690 [Gammaproteobacteria bacterium]|nr:hypothetical protein [Gammaproteobacteria bacterium]